MQDLTTEEERAIASLKRLAQKWPKSLWLLCDEGGIIVMKKDKNGKIPEIPDPSGHTSDVKLDPAYRICDIYGIQADGGWL